MPGAERTKLKDDVDATLTASRALVGVVARSLAEVLEQITLPQFRVLVVLLPKGRCAAAYSPNGSASTSPRSRARPTGSSRRDGSVER